ncbi:hypothetical protein ACFO0S_14585 [Chryseomicrobium palamuruense]|uniref:Transposase n=1 Tax=Chryseomicrobium palamuruense TaxID=682973 RepID=A0ABV8UY52_9BACL
MEKYLDAETQELMCQLKETIAAMINRKAYSFAILFSAVAACIEQIRKEWNKNKTKKRDSRIYENHVFTSRWN